MLALAEVFPGAPLYTSMFEPGATYPELGTLDVHTTWLSRVGALRRHHRLALPLLGPVMSRFLVDADVAICSSSGWAHGANVTGAKVVYCYAPARWLYQRDRYVGGDRARALALAMLGPTLRRWDRKAADSADRYLVLSTHVAAAVREHYGIEAEVVPPPVMVDVAGDTRPVGGVEPGAWLCVSRLLAYKNVDAVVAAFAQLPHERLVVVGEGPDAAGFRAAAPDNVQLVGTVADAELRWLYVNVRGAVAAAYEDFGLTPLEAAAFGRPSAVLAAGGYLDTVVDGETGVYFDAPRADAIADAVTRLAERSWDPDVLRAHVARFSLAVRCPDAQRRDRVGGGVWMRIVLTIHHFLDRATGAPGITLALAEEYARLGHDVEVIGFDGLHLRDERLCKVAFPAYVAARLRVLQRAAPIDVVDSSSGDAAVWCLTRAHGRRPLLVVRSHGLEHPTYESQCEDARRGLDELSWHYRFYQTRLELPRVNGRCGQQTSWR